MRTFKTKADRVAYRDAEIESKLKQGWELENHADLHIFNSTQLVEMGDYLCRLTRILKHLQKVLIAKITLMRTTAKAIHNAIINEQPDTWEGLKKIIFRFRYRNGLAWGNVYYFGYYQGVRLFYFDSKGRKIALPSSDGVYCIKENKELPTV